MSLELIEEYYRFVDSGKIEELLELFSDDAVYVRAGKVISGKDNLRRFYLEERGLVGKHTIISIHQDGEYVIVEGQFTGTNSSKDSISVVFADVFELEDKCIKKRRTYLGVMSDLIE